MNPLLSMAWLEMPDPGWLWHMLAFIAIWTGALFVVQARTLVSPQDNTPRFARWAPRIRLLIDLCFTTAVTMFVPLSALIFVPVVIFVIHVGLMAYYQYFRRPLSALTVYHSWREGARASSHSVSTHLRPVILVFGSVMLLQIALVVTSPGPGVGRETLWTIGGIAAVCYIVLLVLASWIDPLSKILTTRGIGRLGLIRGYFVTWLAEFYYLGKRQVLESAIRQRQITSDVLTPLEASIPIRRQAGDHSGGESRFQRVGRPARRSGSHSVLESPPRAIDVLSDRRGSIHWFGGRRFRHAQWRDALDAHHHLQHSRLSLPQHAAAIPGPIRLSHVGVSRQHRQFLQSPRRVRENGFCRDPFRGRDDRAGAASANRAGESRTSRCSNTPAGCSVESTGHVCHFIITLTTHTPYTLLERRRAGDLRVSADRLRKTISTICAISTTSFATISARLTSATVVIYSDHPADPAVAPEFVPDCRGQREFVPCLIYDTESDLAAIQRTRDQRDRRRRKLDTAGHLHVSQKPNCLEQRPCAVGDEPKRRLAYAGHELKVERRCLDRWLTPSS